MERRARGHLSMRPQRTTLAALERRARHEARPKTVVAERYLREGVQMDEHPGVYFVDGALGRRAAVLGSGLDVWEIVRVVKDNAGSAEEAAAYLEVDPRLVEVAIRYYGSNRDEIDELIARVDEFNELEEAKARAARVALR